MDKNFKKALYFSEASVITEKLTKFLIIFS